MATVQIRDEHSFSCKLMAPVQIRKDLRENYSFSTNSGILVDNDSTYESRYINENKFQILINGNWETIEGIDFEFLN